MKSDCCVCGHAIEDHGVDGVCEETSINDDDADCECLGFEVAE